MPFKKTEKRKGRLNSVARPSHTPLMARKFSHYLHLPMPESLPCHHTTKRQRCKDTDEKYKKDMIICGEEEFSFESSNLDIMDLVFNLYLCSDQSWTQQHFSEPEHFSYDDILFYNGSMIAIERMSLGVRMMELILELDHYLKLRANMSLLLLPTYVEYYDDLVYDNDSLSSLIETLHGVPGNDICQRYILTTPAFHAYTSGSQDGAG